MDVALGRVQANNYYRFYICLNPCCNGCRTWAMRRMFMDSEFNVLILVVMDVALGHYEGQFGVKMYLVLILVVMDVALGPNFGILMHPLLNCLNPCCNGCRTWAIKF